MYVAAHPHTPRFAALGETSEPQAERSIPFEQKLSEFQIGVAKATGEVLSKLSFLDKKLSGAEEWATNMNNFAASVVASLMRKTASGAPFYAVFPLKAAKLLGESATWAEEESKQYDEARAQLLETSRVPAQAVELLGTAAGRAAAKMGKAAAQGIAAEVEAAFNRAKKEGVESLLYMLAGLGLVGTVAYYLVFRR